METPPTKPSWRPRTSFLFRFGLIYFVLYNFPSAPGYVPNLHSIAAVLGQEWEWLSATDPFYTTLYDIGGWFREQEWLAIDWMAETVFGVPHELDRPRGSGDPTHSYLRTLLHTIVAALGATLWSVLARRGRGHPKLAPWLHLAGRYVLALTLLGYGIAKVIPTQFGPPSPTRLLASYGDSSPMNVLWTFMGTSTPYIIFGGAGEVLGAVLLIFRRTATLGALVSVGVMTNVVALNFCYDVPVKLYSTHLLVLALCLCIPDARRLAAVLLWNRATEPRSLRAPYTPVIGHVMRILIVVPTVVMQVQGYLTRYDSRSEYELSGIWDVTSYQSDGVERPPLTTDPTRWQNLILGSRTSGVVRGMQDTRSNHTLDIDLEAGTMSLSTYSSWHAERDGDRLTLRGEFQREWRSSPWPQPGEALRSEHRDPQVEVVLQRRPETTAAGDPEDPTPAGETTNIPVELVGRWDVVARETGPTFLTRRRETPFDWVSLTIRPDGTMSVHYADDSADAYQLGIDTSGTWTIISKATLSLERSGEDRLRLSGELRGHTVDIAMTRRDLDEFLLVRRGFHWINEYPFNRY